MFLVAHKIPNCIARKMKSVMSLISMFLCSSLLHACQNNDTVHWPSWRGPTSNGHAASSANPPTQWSESINLRWKTGIPGLGNSTPSIAGNQIILTSAAATGRKVGNPTSSGKPNEFHELLVISYDFETGAELKR